MALAGEICVELRPARIMPEEHERLIRLNLSAAGAQNGLCARMVKFSCVIDSLCARYRADETHGGFARAFRVGAPDDVRREAARGERCANGCCGAASSVIEGAFMVA